MRLSFGLSFLSLTSIALAAYNATAEVEQADLQQITKQLPACAVQCLAEYVPASGCSLTDTACICTNTNLTLALGGCLTVNCTVVEALQTQRFQETSCGAPVRSQQDETLRVTWILFALAMVAIAGRFAARAEYFKGAGYGLDDWGILFCGVLLAAITIVGHLMIDDGLGRDMWMLEPRNISSVLRYFWVEEMLYSYCVSFTKMSIVLFYLRIFPSTVSTTFRKICWILVGLFIAMPTAFALATAFQCNPVSFSWTGWDGQHE